MSDPVREALEFYADEASYLVPVVPNTSPTAMDHDQGAKARQALASLPDLIRRERADAARKAAEHLTRMYDDPETACDPAGQRANIEAAVALATGQAGEGVQ